MLNVFKLLLPALVPSWRFFDIIAPSPRIQYALLPAAQADAADWQAFHPRPQQLAFISMCKRLFWNPSWNDILFTVSCAERLLQQPTRHSEDEILKRIGREILSTAAPQTVSDTGFLQFRLLLIQRQGTQLLEQIAFYSRIVALAEMELT